MRVLIITLHDTDNCGSSLQAFALQKYVETQGHECEIINYTPLYAKTNGRLFRYIIKRLVVGKLIVGREQQFQQFKEKYLHLTSTRYHFNWELTTNPPHADLYIAGSDQLWNDYFKCGKDLSFYLNFVVGSRKVAYAISLGKDTISDKQYRRISDYTKDFECISVREKKSRIDLINKGLDKVEYVCDPTLLLEKQEYLNILETTIQEEYILVYMIPRSKLLDMVLSQLKRKYGCKVVYVGGKVANCDCDTHISICSPTVFLGLIANAKYIVAGSFHALMFSCIFSKEFVILPYKNNARMKQFLNDMDIAERYISTIKEIDVLDREIDFIQLRSNIDILVENSKKFLAEVLVEKM